VLGHGWRKLSGRRSIKIGHPRPHRRCRLLLRPLIVGVNFFAISGMGSNFLSASVWPCSLCPLQRINFCPTNGLADSIAAEFHSVVSLVLVCFRGSF